MNLINITQYFLDYPITVAHVHTYTHTLYKIIYKHHTHAQCTLALQLAEVHTFIGISTQRMGDNEMRRPRAIGRAY